MFCQNILSGICLFALASSILSAPAPTPLGYTSASPDEINVITTRNTPPVPSVDEIKPNLNVPAGVSLFYSGPGGYAKQARTWARNQKNGYKVLGQLWKDSSYPDKWQSDQDTSTKFFNVASQAMAELSAGTVYVMLPSDTTGTKWKADTVWDKYEWPNLASSVERVIRINPDNQNKEIIKGSYTSGQCGVHVTQYQKNEPKSNPTGDYKFDITIKDAAGATIGTKLGATAKNGVGVDVDSMLPLVLIVTAQKVDDDAVLFKYGDQSWGSNDHQHCKFGKYDSGNRDGDCGFTC